MTAQRSIIGQGAQRFTELLIVALAFSVLVSGPLSIVGATASQSQSQAHAVTSVDTFSTAVEDVDPDQIRMNVALATDGSAEWTVEFWVHLDDSETGEAFESIEGNVDEDPSSYVTRFADRIKTTVATASDATDREMSADEFSVETERQSLAREYGVIRYTFEWRGFAAVDDTQLRAGDAIEGLYLDDGTRLLISWPESYELTDVTPDPDDRRQHAVIWHGSQTDFVSGEPRLNVSNGTGGLSFPTVALGLVALGALGLVVAMWYRRRDSSRIPVLSSKTSDKSSEAEPIVDRDTKDNQTSSEDFLSNEERVLRLLEERGGRMKQQDVVSELDWTDAKTSKVVSGLREEGKLESFRLGRENVLTLPDQEDTLLEFDDQHE